MSRNAITLACMGAACGATALALATGCVPAFGTDCRRDLDCPVAQRCDQQQRVCVAAVVAASDAAARDVAIDSATPDSRRADATGADLTRADATRRDVPVTDVADRDAAAPDAVLPDSNLPDANLPDALVLDVNAPDTHLPDTNLPDANLPDTHLPDTNVQDAHAPDTHLPDTNRPDANARDGALADAALPDMAEPDSGVICSGCTIDDVCYGWWDHNPSNPCEWCLPTQSHRWTKIDGPVCVSGESCTCLNGVLSDFLCEICSSQCDRFQGICCGASGDPCCSGPPRCDWGFSCDVMTETCGGMTSCGYLGEPCCNNFWCDESNGFYCCNGTCELAGICGPEW